MAGALKPVLICLFLLYAGMGMCQVTVLPDTSGLPQQQQIRSIDINPRYSGNADTLVLRSGICKTLKTQVLTGERAASLLNNMFVRKSSFLKVQGSVRYDYLFRTFADTPYYQKDFRQHTLQTSLTVTVKDQYPLRVNFVIRKSNSPYFKNFFDGGMLFDRFSYYKSIRQRLAEKMIKKIPGLEYLESAQSLLKKKLDEFNKLKQKLENPNLAQMIIEERERLYYQSVKKPGAPEMPGMKKPSLDSLTGDLQHLVKEKKAELDSLQQDIAKLQKKVDSLKYKAAGDIASIKQKIYNAKNQRDLKKIGGPEMDDAKDKWGHFISNLRTAGIGRSVVNYSELTASNVALTGVNLEYTPRLYTAVVAGKVDYGFRDFFGRNSRDNNQYLLMGRIGTGDIDKRAVIFTLYTGRKANYAGAFSDTIRNYIPVTGYSVELIMKKDQYTSFTAEVAKSSRPFTGRSAPDSKAGHLFSFGDATNLGISFKGETQIAETSTKLSGLFRKTGENFQSFSLFNYNTDQVAWMIKAEQPLFKEKLLLTGILRKNDFVNPFTDKTYKTTTTFGSFQAALRIPHWPSVTIGYYPGSQLYIVDRNRIRENMYYMANGTIVHQYKLFGVRMVTSAIYNNYTSKGTDSGFINYNGTNYLLSHSLVFRQTQLQGIFSFTDQQELRYYTAEGNADFRLGKLIKAGAGVKYNRILKGNHYWGGQGQLILDIPKMGSLQFQYEKSFLPTVQQTLFPVETGRLSWFKTF